jgi:hypothetical protein
MSDPRLYLLRFAEGRTFRTRCNALVVIVKMREDGMTGQIRFGSTDKILVEYNLSGKKRPLGGEDPFDIV